MKRRVVSLQLVTVSSLGCASERTARATNERALDYPEPYRRLHVRDVSIEAVAGITSLAGKRHSFDASTAREVVRRELESLGLFRVVDAPPTTVTPKDGLVLDLAFERAALVHTGETEDASLALWLWVFTGLPGLSVHDQVFAVTYEARARIIDGTTNEVVVPWRPLAAPDLAGRALSFHERSSGFLSYLKTCCIP